MGKKNIMLLVLLLFVVFIQIILAISIYMILPNWTDRGTFGDMFGAVNTLFSGLAFAGVIYAIILQSKELELQRTELELTRKEMEKSADSLADQVKQLSKKSKLDAASTKLNTYTLLSINEKMIPETDIKATSLISKTIKEIDMLLK